MHTKTVLSLDSVLKHNLMALYALFFEHLVEHQLER